jgi:hypothetical protein
MVAVAGRQVEFRWGNESPMDEIPATMTTGGARCSLSPQKIR